MAVDFMQVTHLGYYRSEEEAAMVYDRVAVSMNGLGATTNFPAARYMRAGGGEFFGAREGGSAEGAGGEANGQVVALQGSQPEEGEVGSQGAQIGSTTLTL